MCNIYVANHTNNACHTHNSKSLLCNGIHLLYKFLHCTNAYRSPESLHPSHNIHMQKQIRNMGN